MPETPEQQARREIDAALAASGWLVQDRRRLNLGRMSNQSKIVPARSITPLIRLIRDVRVILDTDLALLYGVETRALVQAVKRNADRFPEDFLFQLTPAEVAALRSQIVISKTGRGGRRYPPYAFSKNTKGGESGS